LGSSTSKALPVIVITGQSGAGKGTLIRELSERIASLELAVSATTRPRRPGEVEGRHYYFMSDEEFQRRVDEGAFLETFEFPWGQRSGTLWAELDRIRGRDGVPLLELETNGALEVARRVPDSVTIFITAPLPELERRLRERATESAGEISERIELAKDQLEQAALFDYLVENDDRERAAEELTEIVNRTLVTAGTMSRP
jgi:guanylate kinase